jgi:hypothetical protein
MSPDWQMEMERFRQLNPTQKNLWFVIFANFLSMLARGAYSPGTLGVDDPTALRNFNELLHAQPNNNSCS